MSETIAIIAILACLSGAILSTIKGYWKADGGYSGKKLVSSLIIAGFTSFSLVNFNILADTINTIGLVGLVTTYLTIGFGVDQGLSSLDK